MPAIRSKISRKPSRRTGLRVALLAVPLTVAGALAAAPADASPGPASLTCQGKGVDQTAKARHRAEILIHAPLPAIWGLHTDVEAWTSWQKPAAPMTVRRLDPGPLRKHSRFQATVRVPSAPPATVVISSTVQQLQRGKCLRWTGPADSAGYHIDGVHVWTFSPVRGGVLVRTEESHRGPQADPTSDMGLETWLADLKTAAESGRRGRHLAANAEAGRDRRAGEPEGRALGRSAGWSGAGWSGAGGS
ncbi:SRPBCC family protein [Amycolatopsis rubida]|uniref:Polyketide cyclase / dehydrase and lipid transport n=1 Tax=Amycolatopsis rubida TaxID=112413 RepID=A0A1I6AQF8_9PSEU|nr:Polyketide cyclase / dehydrase and lipid transport [Amycolatopsis rubida]